LTQHANVREAVVVAREQANGEKRLIAYVVTDEANSIAHELRDLLRQKLPEYMVPSSFVTLEELPLTPSGKLNRRALPGPDDSADRGGVTMAKPQTALEKSLVAIWSEVLGVNGIGINDNFFDLGGHSLLAVRLFTQIEKKLGKRLSLAILFQAPTVTKLAAILQRDYAASWSSLVPIQPLGSKPPFFCVHAVGGTVIEYHALARHLGPDQPFYALQSRGLDGNQEPHKSIHDMAAHYIKEMREVQPDGPYLLGGRSLGGIIAYEMACQLRAKGEEVSLLAVLDSYPVGYDKLVSEAESLTTRGGRARAHLSNLNKLSLHEKFLYVINKSQYGPVRIKSKLWRAIYSSYHKFGRELPRAMRDVQQFNWLAAYAYVPKRYEDKVTLFWASGDLRASHDLVEGWRVLAKGGLEIHEVPGTHLDIIREPHVAELAEKLNACLTRAQGSDKHIAEVVKPEVVRVVNPPTPMPLMNESQAA
jgi:thioesterase domain-containing protein/acyl carrier protein